MHYFYNREDKPNKEKQTHVHEFSGSVIISERKEDPHDHRFAGISGEVINVPGGHVHEILTKTDCYEEHLHKLLLRTGLQIPVGIDRHVHFVSGSTTLNDNHNHHFQFATLIENPTGINIQ